MKKTIINFTTLLTFGALTSFSQNVGINQTGANAHPSALLDLDPAPTFNTGFAMPSLTTLQRLAIISPKNGLQVYDTNLYGFYYFNTLTNKWDCVTTPAGTFNYFCNVTAPIGYLECNGQAVNRTAYPELFNAIGTLYGIGDGTTTFNLPDLRGEFIRGVDNGRGVDGGRTIASFQKATTITSDEGLAPATQGLGNISENSVDINTDAITVYWNISTNSGVFSNTQYLGKVRPRNIALLPCIKY